MTSRFSSISLLLVASLAGCGAPLSQSEGTTPEKSAAGGGENCHEERPIGSNISRTVCRTDEEVARDRESTRSFINTPRASPTAQGQASPAYPTTTPTAPNR
jgi:hypothetical protein